MSSSAEDESDTTSLGETTGNPTHQPANVLDETVAHSDRLPTSDRVDSEGVLGVDGLLSLQGSPFTAPRKAGAIAALGNYDVFEVLGSGGFGTVVRAADDKLWRPVAIKLLNKELASSAVARRRFIREARAAASINHPNVVTIYSVESVNDTPFIVMELVIGKTLRERIRDAQPVNLVDMFRISHQITLGLAAAHAKGVIHRDIKPGNILLQDQLETVKISDFGLARAAIDNVELTSRDMAIGTPAYMSPEQIRGIGTDARSDLFALGCVIYSMAVGHSPFHGSNPLEIARRVDSERPAPLHTLVPSIPKSLSDIVSKLLEKSPKNRFQSAEELSEVFNWHLSQINAAPSDKLSLVLRRPLQPTPFKTRLRKSLRAIGLTLATASFLILCVSWIAKQIPSGGDRQSLQPFGAIAPPNDPEKELLATVTVNQLGSGNSDSIAAALSQVAPDGEIKITDDAVYAEVLSLQQPRRYTSLRIVAERGASLQCDVAAPLISLADQPNLLISGLKLLPRDDQVGIVASGSCAGLRLEDLTISRTDGTASAVAAIRFNGCVAPEDRPIRVSRVSISQTSIGMVVERTSDNAQYITIDGCRFLGRNPKRSYLLIATNTSNLTVQRSVFYNAACGISVVNEADKTRDLVFKNCTVADCSSWINWSGPQSPTARARFENNLFWNVSWMLKSERSDWFVNNYWQTAKDALQTESKTAIRVAGIEMKSLDPDDPQFLLPASFNGNEPSALAGIGHGAATVAGAVKAGE